MKFFKGADSAFAIFLLNVIPKMSLWGKYGPRTSKCFVLNKSWCVRVFKGGDSQLGNGFLKSSFENANNFFGQIWYRNFQVFVSNETRCIGVPKCTESESGNYFLNFHSQNTFQCKFASETLNSLL